MRMRLTAAALAALCLAPSVAAQAPKLGVQSQIEYTDKTPIGIGGWKQLEFIYPITQGDKLRVQVEPFRGADMKFWVAVHNDAGGAWGTHQLTSSGGEAKIDMTLEKGLPGKKVKVIVFCNVAGKANVLISKVGDEPADDPKDAKIKKLETENASLKKKLDEMQAQLADIKKLLEKKK